MRYEIGFGVGFTGTGEVITDKDELMKIVLVEACNRFGGCHVTFGQGAWISPAGALVVEEAATLTVMSLPTGRLFTDETELAEGLAEFIRRLFRQEAVLLTKIVATTSLRTEPWAVK